MQFPANRIHIGPFRDVIPNNLLAIVDGRPMQQGDILRIRPVDIIAAFDDLLTPSTNTIEMLCIH